MASSVWPGTAKLAEECGELVQVIMKIVSTAGTMQFLDGQTVGSERLVEEMADVEAALEFVRRHALTLTEQRALIVRRSEKLNLFERWRREEASRT